MSEMVPEGWEIKNLGDLTTVITKGTTPKTYCNEGINFIKVESISTSKTLIPEKFAKIDFLTHQSQKRSQLKHGDILFGIAGSLGRLAVVEAKDLPANTNQALAIIRLDNGTINRSFCLHQLAADKIQLEIKNLQTVGAQPNLSLKQVSDFEVYAPPLPEQKKIASILTSVDEVIETTQKQIDKLQDLKKATMNELLTKGIGHTEFKDTELGRIPKSWEVVRFSDVLNGIDAGWSPLCIEMPPDGNQWGVLKISAVTKGVFLELESKTLPPNEYPRLDLAVQKGDILLTRANGNADLVGKCVRVLRKPSRNLMLSDKILRLLPNEKATSGFLLAAFNSEITRKQIELCWGGSSGQKNIGQNDIKSFKLALPPVDEQSAIDLSLTSIDDSLQTLALKLAQTQSLKKSLMQDLLTGKVRVQVN